MIKKNFYLEDGETLYTLDANDLVERQRRAREDFLFMQKTNENYINLLKSRKAQLESEIEARAAKIAEKDAEIAQKDAEIAELRRTLSSRQTEL